MVPTPAAVVSPPEQEFSTPTTSERKHESEWLMFLKRFPGERGGEGTTSGRKEGEERERREKRQREVTVRGGTEWREWVEIRF